MIRTIVASIAIVLGVARAEALPTEALLDSLQHTAFGFFWNEANASNGLIKDRSTTSSPASIASMGFGLSAICIGIDHEWVTREVGRDRVLTTLQTLWNKPQGSGSSGYIGYQGLYYHFLDMTTATRTWDCELSTIDTALLFAGIIDARQYFSTSDPVDIQVRALADTIVHRARWDVMRNFTPGIMMGWKPIGGFNGFGYWVGYNEAMILYILALGAPTYSVPASCWTTWTSGYNWSTQYGYQYVNFPPLFGHQYSHCWIDFRHQWDAKMQGYGITYFENSRRATMAQREYCIANPGGWVGYGANLWGITASDVPGGYNARGAPPAMNDDGTISPTAPAGSIPFAPDVVIPTLHNLYDTYHDQLWSKYGFKDAFNLTVNWWGTDYIGIDQGPIIVMIENYRTGAVWNRFMQNPDVQRGLQRAGFVATSVDIGPVAARDGGLLFQSSPNPMRGAAWIQLQLPDAGPVVLDLYDVRGRRIQRLLEGPQTRGRHLVKLDGAGLPSGVYFYRLEYGDKRETRQCLVVK